MSRLHPARGLRALQGSKVLRLKRGHKIPPARRRTVRPKSARALSRHHSSRTRSTACSRNAQKKRPARWLAFIAWQSEPKQFQFACRGCA